MKHLTDYIKECIEIDFNTNNEQVNESSEKWFRINLNDFKGAYDSLKALANEKSLYNEPIDNGIKIKVKEGQAELLSSVIEFLTELVNSKQEDEEMKDACERLSLSIVEMSDYMEDKAEEAEEKAKEDAEDAKKKAEEVENEGE